MRVPIKTKEQVEVMKEGGRILAQILQLLKQESKAGVSTRYIERIADDLCKKYGVIPSCKGYMGFPGAYCSCVNDTVVHGIPSDMEILKDGDVFTIDMVITHKGLMVDAAITTEIGQISKEKQDFLDTVKEARDKAIKLIREGAYTGDLSAMMEYTVRSHGYSPVREMTGHGIGKDMHEDPMIPCYGMPGTGEMLRAGMVVAIEAIIAMGRPEIIISKKDGWTAKTKDGSIAAVFEHTVAVLQNGYDILTV